MEKRRHTYNSPECSRWNREADKYLQQAQQSVRNAEAIVKRAGQCQSEKEKMLVYKQGAWNSFWQGAASVFAPPFFLPRYLDRDTTLPLL